MLKIAVILDKDVAEMSNEKLLLSIEAKEIREETVRLGERVADRGEIQLATA